MYLGSVLSIPLGLCFLASVTNAIAPYPYSYSSARIQLDDASDSPYLTTQPSYPVVLLHGITSDKNELAPVADWLKQILPASTMIFNLEIGNGKINSLFKTMDWQLNELCYTIYNMPELENGFHFIGMSQGGLLARGYVERCNRFPVKNLITWVSPQAGVYGINDVYFNWEKVYTPAYQSLYSFAGYWKDPQRYGEYLAQSSFLPYLNNESPNLEEYGVHGFDFYKNRENMLSLDNFVMIWSAADDVITPPQSGKFEFYAVDGDAPEPSDIESFFNSSQYKNDLLGLRSLYQWGKLHMLETNCTHSGHKTLECFPQLEVLTLPFLM